MTNQEIKKEIIKRLLETNREGIKDTVKYLEESDFFSTGCHTHHMYNGGLARHSLETCEYALSNGSNLPVDSVIIASILHDTCSAHSYVARHIHRHGRRSVRVLKEICHLKLTKEEYEAILLHMHREASAMKTNALARLIYKADKVSASGRVRL